jgi:uncharacterized protein YpbB
MLPSFQSNPRLELADQYVRFTNTNVFLTGKAGTGKTTFLKNIKATSPKRMVIVAPTGVAAINAGGVTIHSFFQLSFGPNIPDNKPIERRINNEKIKAIKAIDLLVIDEISMVRADVLDAIDEVLRRFRNRNLPFGGVQLLMIGDLHQLAPVIKEDEWNMLRPYYPSVYFFESKALALSNFITIELTHIFRQADEQFIGLLNKVRDKKLDAESTRLLNTRYIPDFKGDKDEKYITLTSHNKAALAINTRKLSELEGKTHSFIAEITEEFPESMYPNELNLELKVGAQVMFVKNDIGQEKRYFNGKLGEITAIDDNEISVKCPNETEKIVVTKATWGNIKYVLDESKTMQEHIIGTFSQFPIKAAWAITIHKSQGLTFDRAIIDAASSFAHGQVYVALSRCKTFEGLVLSTPITPESVKSDSTISSFDQETEKQDLSENALFEAKKITQSDWIRDLFDFKLIKSNLNYLRQTIEAAQNQFVAKTLQDVSEIVNNYVEIDTVIDKFSRQLESFIALPQLPEENAELQERIKKGSVYLAGKLQELTYNSLKIIDLSCDNKETKSGIVKIWEQGMKHTFEKLMLLQNTQHGFDSTKYLSTKANIALDFEAEKSRLLKSQKTTESGGNSNDLFNQLRVWRDSVANDKNIEKYMVLSQKTLQALAEGMPRSKVGLAEISGFGKIKIQQYGDEILDIIIEFCEANGIEVSTIERVRKPAKKALVKGSTQELSYNLFKEGKTIAEIAEIRQFAASTIEGHLGEYVKNGLLDVKLLMQEKKIKAIREFMLENPELKGSALKEALGEGYSYGEIRLVGASMQVE